MSVNDTLSFARLVLDVFHFLFSFKLKKPLRNGPCHPTLCINDPFRHAFLFQTNLPLTVEIFTPALACGHIFHNRLLSTKFH